MSAVTGSEALEEARGAACFGRFMIDFPSSAVVAGHRSEFMFGMIQSERTSPDVDAFSQVMQRREDEVKLGIKNDDYRFVSTRSPTISSRIFVSEDEAFGRRLFQVEFHSLQQGVHFSLSRGPYNEKTIDQAVERIQLNLLPNLRARAASEIPTDPGLCIKHGFIASDGSERASESVEISLDFEHWPDMELTIKSSMVYVAEPSLLDRVNSAEVPVEYLPLLRHIKTIRKGRRDVGDYTGEELLEMLPSDGGYMTHAFRWESHFELDDPFKPALVVELTTGRRSGWDNKRPTISEQEAVELFDAVVNSIRLRPTTPAKPAPEPNAALGTPLMTGRTCPQNGLWEAEDGGRRYFSEGDTLPAIRVAGKPSFIERLRGTQPLERRATLWTLVAYGPDPAAGQDPTAGSKPAPDDPSPLPERS